jgi:hypothetical protein
MQWTLTLFLLVSLSLFTGGSYAYAKDDGHGNGNQVALDGSALGEFHYNACPPLTIFLTNRFPHDQTVLVDIELHNSSGALVDQQFFDAYTVSSTKKTGGSTFLTNACSAAPLANDTYTYSVGLFKPGWNGLLQWYSDVASFTVQVTPAATIQLVRIDRPKINLANGASASITPTLIQTAPTQSGLTVVVSLWRGGNFIDSVTYTNQTFIQNTEISFPFHTIPLMQGSYTIKTVVTDSGGNTVATFPDLGTIAVNGP